jgi:ubiquinone/menaquinone biosynthesis C-methylase UbiE
MPKDLFSRQASLYAQYRPVYPPELFDYVLSFVPEKNIAWDCATGNGQAALVLAGHFKKVYATDISEKQLQQASLRDNIVYSVAAAERTEFPDQLFDCITVAQAYHWFDFTAFHQELLRVARPGAILAVWGYGLVVCEEETINQHIGTFYRNVTGPYWDRERRFVDDHYTTVPFPFEELPGKEFTIDVNYTLSDLEGYLNTWSSVQHFIKANGYNPVTEFCSTLKRIWQDGKTRKFYFPVFLRIGKIL